MVQIMKVYFFESKDGSLDERAIGPGVYEFLIGSTKAKRKDFLPLYIGESYAMASRCADHLYDISQREEHIAIPNELLDKEDLCLLVKVYESVDIPEGVTYQKRDAILRKHEVEAIKEVHPISQFDTSDKIKPDATETVLNKWKKNFEVK